MKKKFQLILAEELSIRAAPKLKASLVEALTEYQEISIRVCPPSVLDVSCLQLLIAAKRHADNMDKQLNLEFELPEGAKELLNNAGFRELIENN